MALVWDEHSLAAEEAFVNPTHGSAQVIELIGLPAAGKTTVGRRAAESLDIQLWEDWKLPQRYSWLPPTLQLFILSPVASLCLYALVGTRSSSSSVNFKRVVSITRRHIAIARFPSGGPPILVDEGPLHSLFVTLYGTQPTRVSRQLLPIAVAILTRRVTAFTLIDTSKERCIKNFQSPGRTSARFNALAGQEEIETFLADSTYSEIVQVLREREATLIIADGTDEAVEAIRAAANPR